MHVVHVGNYKPDSPNGVDQMIAALARHLPSCGVTVELWHFTSHVKAVQRRSIDGIEVIDLPFHARRIVSVLRVPPVTRQFLHERAAHVQLMHLHSVFTPEDIVCSKLGVPYVITPHGGYDQRVLQGRHRLLKSIWRWLWEDAYIARASLLHAVSEPEAAHLARLWPAALVRCMPNGVEPSLLEALWQRPSQGRYLGFMGRIAIDQKGLDLFAFAYALAERERSGSLPSLVCAGPNFRDGQRNLTAIWTQLGIADKLKFVGALQNEGKFRFLQGCRVFVHTSRWEGMPLALLEAMATGRPVLVTTQTNLGGLVHRHGAGWVTTLDPVSIADGIRQACSATDDEIDERGERAQQLVRDQFTWPRIVSAVADQYRRLLR